MIRFDLSEILRTPGMRQTYAIHENPYADDDVEFLAPIVGKITVTNTGTLLLVRGPLDTVIAQECSRCLEPVRSPLHLELEEDFELNLVEGAAPHDQSAQVIEDEIARVFDGPILCLNVLIRQAALVEAPWQPLCREACPGIPIPESATETEEDKEAFKNAPFGALAQIYKNEPTTD